jgi:ElaB/YqjD/DUF883 family membrane-anchored ribosome-binding protein
MKVTKAQLKQIIKEEITRVLEARELTPIAGDVISLLDDLKLYARKGETVGDAIRKLIGAEVFQDVSRQIRNTLGDEDLAAEVDDLYNELEVMALSPAANAAEQLGERFTSLARRVRAAELARQARMAAAEEEKYRPRKRTVIDKIAGAIHGRPWGDD